METGAHSGEEGTMESHMKVADRTWTHGGEEAGKMDSQEITN